MFGFIIKVFFCETNNTLNKAPIAQRTYLSKHTEDTRYDEFSTDSRL